MKQARDRATEGISFTAAHSAELYPLIYTAQGLLDWGICYFQLIKALQESLFFLVNEASTGYRTCQGHRENSIYMLLKETCYWSELYGKLFLID